MPVMLISWNGLKNLNYRGHVDEQTGESSHQDFSKFCQGKLMENIHDDRYLENLRKLVVAYASMHRKSKLCF